MMNVSQTSGSMSSEQIDRSVPCIWPWPSSGTCASLAARSGTWCPSKMTANSSCTGTNGADIVCSSP
eukprot:1893722-Pleurochrysis_carterae.AAC.1